MQSKLDLYHAQAALFLTSSGGISNSSLAIHLLILYLQKYILLSNLLGKWGQFSNSSMVSIATELSFVAEYPELSLFKFSSTIGSCGKNGSFSSTPLINDTKPIKVTLTHSPEISSLFLHRILAGE